VGKGGAAIVSVPGRTPTVSRTSPAGAAPSVDSPAMPLISAHLGHWYASLLYVAPVALIVVVLAVQSRRDRRRGDGDQED